ncbi:MAG TPA: hypothetical protein DCZ48_04360, partial [Methylococcaceae bacterium]|nr:hypothetical protein [Methylococcaceae bacterium]
ETATAPSINRCRCEYIRTIRINLQRLILNRLTAFFIENKRDRRQCFAIKYLFISFNMLYVDKLKQLDFVLHNTKMITNNTPPASRQISAPRGVTRFWGQEKSAAEVAGGLVYLSYFKFRQCLRMHRGLRPIRIKLKTPPRSFLFAIKARSPYAA